jgi:DNA end-binding protein Ku
MMGSFGSFAMAPRANWQGFPKLSLVSCGVALVQVTSSTERTRLNIINRETGNHIGYRRIDAEAGEDVPEAGRVKGYKVADSCGVLLEPGELDEVALQITHTMAIEAFVPRKKIGEIHLDPLDKGIRATALRRGPAKNQTPQTRKLTQRGS